MGDAIRLILFWEETEDVAIKLWDFNIYLNTLPVLHEYDFNGFPLNHLLKHF